MISIVLSGNLGADAQLKKHEDGREYLFFSVASNEKRSGEELTQWVSCFTYQTALLPYLTKGTYVTVLGRARFGTYQDREGVVHPEVLLTAQTLELGPRPKERAEPF